MIKEPMKMLIFLVALCFLLFCSAKHLCFTLEATKDRSMNGDRSSFWGHFGKTLLNYLG